MNDQEVQPDLTHAIKNWTVYRVDDNGNVFVVKNNLSREEAERLVAEFEARGHKQMYWAEVG